MIVTKISPMPSMHARLPHGWTISTKADSQEVIVLCDKCPSSALSVPPSALKPDES
jgi:hypothetical protein